MVVEAAGRHCGSDLAQRALQAIEHRLLPGTARPDAAAIEIEHVHRAILTEQQVVRVQVGVVHAVRVQPAHACAHCAPGRGVERCHGQRMRQGAARRQLCCDQVGAVEEPVALVARGFAEKLAVSTLEQVRWDTDVAILAGPYLIEK